MKLIRPLFLSLVLFALPLGMWAQTPLCSFSYDMELTFVESDWEHELKLIVDTNLTSATIVSYYWRVNSSLQSTDYAPTFRLTPGNYLICGTAYSTDSSCTLSECKRLSVPVPPCYANVDAEVLGYNSAQGKFDVSLLVNPDSSSTTFDNYSWDFGDGTSSTAANPVHQYNPGNYVACVTASRADGNCIATACEPISLSAPNCELAWEYDFKFKKKYSQYEVEFDFLNKQSTAGLKDLYWDLGNGDVDTRANFFYDYAPGIYVVCLTASDDSICTITQCDTLFLCDDCFMWPGDANNDSIVDNMDVLYIGIAHGKQSYARADTSTDWMPHNSRDWEDHIFQPIDFASGTNVKHADSDGDGVVSVMDFNAVHTNFGKSIPYSSTPVDQCGCNNINDAPLLITANVDTVQESDTVRLTFTLGDSLRQVGPGYGFAFDLSLDFNYVNPNSIQVLYDSTNVWPNDSSFKFTRLNIPFNKVESAASRLNLSNSNMDGDIIEFIFVMEDDLVQGILGPPNWTQIVAMPIDICNVKLIDSAENEIPVCTKMQPIFVKPPKRNKNFKLAPEDMDVDPVYSIQPNPFTNAVRITLPNEANGRIYLRNTLGQLVINEPIAASGNVVDLNLNTLALGVYFLTVEDEAGERVYVQKVVKK